jgi:hypothetical protein
VEEGLAHLEVYAEVRILPTVSSWQKGASSSLAARNLAEACESFKINL